MHERAFFEAWCFLETHPAFIDESGQTHFQRALDIQVVLVNPATLHIDDDPARNTKLHVWLECGAWWADAHYAGYTHDPALDCGGDTFEEAIITLAKRVAEQYGRDILAPRYAEGKGS